MNKDVVLCKNCKQYPEKKGWCATFAPDDYCSYGVAATGQWIPVSKHMPEERHGYFSTGIHYSDDLLVTILDVEAGESFLGMGYICDGVWYLTSKQGYLTDEKIEQGMKYKVTAWAELQEPYVLTAEEREAMEKEEEE